MLARVLAMALCLSVCARLSVTSRSSIETDERIELFLARELPSTHPTLCSEEIRVSPKTRVLPSGTLSQTLDFKNSFGISIVETCYRLRSRKVDAQSVINWTVVDQRWQYLRAPTLVY